MEASHHIDRGVLVHRVIHLPIASLLLLCLAGCSALGSLSTSSESISDSVQGLSNSISRSSEALSRSSASIGDDDATARLRYREDVRLATDAWVGSGADVAAFLRDLGRVAERHGISDWEARPETLLGIGAGARQAGLAEADLDALLAQLGQADAGQRALAQRGWRSAGL